MQLSDWAQWPSCQANLGLASWFSCLIAVWPWVGYLGSLRLEWGEKTFRGRTEILHIKHSRYNAWDHLVSDREKWDWRLLSPSARRQIGSIALLHLWLSLTKNLSTTSLYTPDQNSARSILSQYWFPALVTSGFTTCYHVHDIWLVICLISSWLCRLLALSIHFCPLLHSPPPPYCRVLKHIPDSLAAGVSGVI